jgi:flagellar biosynthesis protein FlhB
VAVVVVTALVVRANLSDWVRLPTVSTARGLAVIAASLLSWAAWVLGLLMLIGGLDVLITRRQIRRRLMMTRTERDRERREHEGEPVYRGERERIHRELLDFDFPRAVKSSTLLVVAPFESAAALFYDPSVVHAPEVLAKGSGHMAVNLTELAQQLAVPVVENADLARRLQRVPVGNQVPEELYVPVAGSIRDLRKVGSD